jgi:hypothetical protein
MPKPFIAVCVTIVMISLSCRYSNPKNNCYTIGDTSEYEITTSKATWLTPRKMTLPSFLKRVSGVNNNHPDAIVIKDDFPGSWLTYSAVDTLITLVKSKEKCNCIVNPLSSYVLFSDSSDLGGYAIALIKSYKNKQKLSVGLYSCPKTNNEEADELIQWWAEAKRQQKRKF